jgi:hypothetical protein
MLTISFEKELKELSLLGDNRLIVNGVTLQSSHVTRSSYGRPTPKLQASVKHWDEASLLTAYSVQALAEHFAILRFEVPSPGDDFTLEADLRIPRLPEEPLLNLRFALEIDEWAGPWTLSEYQDAVRQVLAQATFQGVSLEKLRADQVNQFSFWCTLPSSNNSAFQEDLDYWKDVLFEAIDTAKAQLAATADRNTLVTFFDFPQNLSTACEQYLLYFVQFLRDLGIEADASIKHEARQVLFSVTPNEGAEALDRIREALEIYLRLPDSPEFVTQAAGYNDIAVQQLQANIFHLNGQLAIAGAVLQAKNAQIEALQLSNFTYQLLATQQQAATLTLLPPGTSDAEPLVPGVIEVTKYEGKGFTVNLPELLRRLKRRFD